MDVGKISGLFRNRSGEWIPKQRRLESPHILRTIGGFQQEKIGGNLLVCETGHNLIHIVDRDGMVLPIAGKNYTTGLTISNGDATNSRFNGPKALEIVDERPQNDLVRIYVSDTHNNCIRLIKCTNYMEEREVSTFCGKPGARGFSDSDFSSKALFSQPIGLVFHSVLNCLFVCDSGNNSIRKIEMNGAVRTICGSLKTNESGKDGIGKEAKILRPHWIAKSASSSMLFVTDRSFTIRKINPFSGEVTTISKYGLFGSLSSLENQTIFQPEGLLVDCFGKILVCDTFNRRLTLFDPISNSCVTTHSTFGLAPTCLSFSSSGEIISTDSLNITDFIQHSMFGWPHDSFLTGVLTCLRANWRLLRILCVQVKNQLKNNHRKRNCLELILWNLCRINQNANQDWRVFMLTILKHISERETIRKKDSLKSVVSFIKTTYQREILQPRIDAYLLKKQSIETNMEKPKSTISSRLKRKRSDEFFDHEENNLESFLK